MPGEQLAIIDSIAVVYLARGSQGGSNATQAFFASYEAHKSGLVHSLHVLVKGWEGMLGFDTVVKSAARLGAQLIPMKDDGFDLGSYFRALPGIDATWICLLNTYSRIRADNWLSYLFRGASQEAVGAAAATGSWESPSHNAYVDMLSSSLLALPQCIARAAYEAGRFPGFPNHHLRTNALMTRKSLFSEFAGRRAIPRRKRDAHMLESGRRGFSVFLRNRGLSLVVCGADGIIYHPEEWPSSATFRSFEQRNLLIDDNQTLLYRSEGETMRRRLQEAAWGRLIDYPSSPDNRSSE